MSAAGIKIATTTAASNSYTTAAAASADEGSVSLNRKATTNTNNEADNKSSDASLNENEAENLSLRNLTSPVKEPQNSSSENNLINTIQNNKVPLENFQQTTENEAEVKQQQQQQQQISPTADAGTNGDLMVNELTKNHLNKQQSGEDVVDITANPTQMSPGLSLLQQTAAASSPPPHSYRHSRAYRHFKNPPQPHMCIRTTTEAGEELFINVLSWTRIVIPQEPSDPIPLYGGMRVSFFFFVCPCALILRLCLSYLVLIVFVLLIL